MFYLPHISIIRNAYWKWVHCLVVSSLLWLPSCFVS